VSFLFGGSEEKMIMGTGVEVIGNCSQNLKIAFQDLADAMKETWEDIKEFVEEYEVKRVERDYIRKSWFVPLKITLINQVVDRKPKMIKARSSC
jgi:hypothetical protein